MTHHVIFEAARAMFSDGVFDSLEAASGGVRSWREAEGRPAAKPLRH